MQQSIGLRSLVLILSCIALIVSQPAFSSDSFRCGSKVIRTGDTPGEVMDRCGVPLHKDRGYGDVYVDSGRQSVRVERWYYKNSKRSLGRTVLIYKGKVIGIETGSR
jgi:hypothetical protein